MNDSRTEHFFIYPKDKAGKPTGHTICVLLSDGRMFHGEALCSKNDQFEKSVGREIALKRAQTEAERDREYRAESGVVKTKSIWRETYGNKDQTFYNVEVKKEGKFCKEVEIKTNKVLDRHWAQDNAECGKLENSGNGVKITLPGRDPLHFNYSEIDYICKLTWLDTEHGPFKHSEFAKVEV